MRPWPASILLRAPFVDQAHSRFDLFRIRVALLDQTHRQAVRAKNQVNSRTVRELSKYGSDPLNQCTDIQRMVMKIIDGALWRFPRGWPPICLIRDPCPFLQAARRRGIGIMRI